MLPLVKRSVKVLGHVVSAEGVAIADNDKAALLQLPRPTTVGVFLGGQLIRCYMPMGAAMSRRRRSGHGQPRSRRARRRKGWRFG